MEETPSVKLNKIYLVAFIVVISILIILLVVIYIESWTNRASFSSLLTKSIVILSALLYIVFFMGLEFWKKIIDPIMKVIKKDR